MIQSNETVAFSRTSPNPLVMRELDTLEKTEGHYRIKIAQTQLEIESALRLRYEVFNHENFAGQLPATNFGLDFDSYDEHCKHLIVLDRLNGKTIGTYRLNSIETAKSANGFYAFNEFSIEDLPYEILSPSVEVSRACIARPYRNSKVLFLLWKSLIDYLRFSRKRYFFGCCSVFTQDCEIGSRVYRHLERKKLVHSNLRVRPRAEHAFPVEEIFNEAEQVELPGLFNLYLKIGAKLCGEPVIDREFGTIDFFVIFDIEEMTEKYRKMFFTEKNKRTYD